MPFIFSVKKAVQVSAYIISKRPLSTTKLDLMKLLYFADRLSFEKQRQPITGDDLCALDHGPIASRILDLINNNEWSPIRDRAAWSDVIDVGANEALSVKCDPGTDELSEYEIELLDETLKRYGQLSTNQLCNLAHSLPEWKRCHVQNSSAPIPLAEIAIALGCEDDLPDMEDDKEFDALIAQLQGR